MLFTVNSAHSLDLHVDSTTSGTKSIVDLRHVERRHGVIIVPTAGVASKENDIEVGSVDRCIVSKSRA